ncbi:DUF2147 domain-containing protein [Roseiarcaceae bacterium H3SJ34-1]|uniref:DUF2147 domain-containing protein n=1 Tax=Terripilifer ovatus TaxID=3032367 RepID=UPI003AB96721|nr:DUF2147 domain-containing protein [Roseiarcaceae bacterium H3SJ34-1]
MRLSALVPVLIALNPVHAVQAQEITGKWARSDGVAQVRIAPCGSQICAVNTAIKGGDGSEKVGDRLVMNVKPAAANMLSGTAYDPQRKMSYNIDITVAENQLSTKGCVLGRLLCKAVSWSRIK